MYVYIYIFVNNPKVVDAINNNNQKIFNNEYFIRFVMVL